jgi:pyruvate/2-oxoglutarate dehydrogenase complex dihydrolipoamide dehydrogenase (E3) component
MSIPLLPDDAHDCALIERVKPPHWVNPKPRRRYQLVVVGGGPAGLMCAAAAAGLGASVALVERDLLGGDCLNVGCVPSKTLLRAAKAAGEVRQAARFGVNAHEPAIDFAKVMEDVRRTRAQLATHDSAERFQSLGVDVFLGTGRFADRQTVEVNGQSLRFGRCVIATGTRPEIPELPALTNATCFTNESIFTLRELPKRLLVLGAGPVGCELAQAFARLGSTVTLAAREGGVLPREDRDLAAYVETALREDGVRIVPTPETPTLFDAVLAATGRRPNVDGLNLEAAGVSFDAKRGIRTDELLRTSNRRIFAAGDVTDLGYRFTHAADAMARLVVRNALFAGRGRASSLIIPWCTYTQPELARIGLSELEASERGIAVSVFQNDSEQLDRAATDHAIHRLKVLVRAGSDRIVGAAAVGPHAGELIGAVSLAMTNGLGLKALANTIFPYPTYPESLKKIADQYNRTRLTPRAKWLLGTWLRWMR